MFFIPNVVVSGNKQTPDLRQFLDEVKGMQRTFIIIGNIAGDNHYRYATLLNDVNQAFDNSVRFGVFKINMNIR